MKGNELDVCLNNGYFRMQQQVFTCQAEYFNNKAHPVLWLRVALATVSYGKDQRQLLRANEKFSVTVKPLVLSVELETLYDAYENFVDFDAPYTVESCLLGGASYNAFATYVIEIRDGDRLIAAGIFDDGARSIAGIMNFYHPDYRKYSLGKYLMLLKINHAQAYRKTHYYPGYLVSGYPKFDYKLFPCQSATEVFDSIGGRWLPFSWKTVADLSAAIEERTGISKLHSSCRLSI